MHKGKRKGEKRKERRSRETLTIQVELNSLSSQVPTSGFASQLGRKAAEMRAENDISHSLLSDLTCRSYEVRRAR